MKLRFQYSLKTLLVVVTLVALALTPLAKRLHREWLERRAIEVLKAEGHDYTICNEGENAFTAAAPFLLTGDCHRLEIKHDCSVAALEAIAATGGTNQIDVTSCHNGHEVLTAISCKDKIRAIRLEIMDAAIADSLRNFPNLLELGVGHVQLNKATQSRLTIAPTLQSLWLYPGADISDETCAQIISQTPHLRALFNFGAQQLATESAAALSQLTELRLLMLEKTSLSPDDFEKIMRGSPRLALLRLGNSQFSSAALIALVDHAQDLRFLGIESTQIDDLGILALADAKLPELSELSIGSNPEVSREAVETFRQRHPSVNVSCDYREFDSSTP